MFEPIKENTEEVKTIDLSDFIINSNTINTDIDNFLTGRIKSGYLSGIECLDKHFVLKEFEFYAMTGKKGAGKTTINQALHIIFTLVNDLKWVVAFQENSYWSMKIGYMNYIFGEHAKDCKRNNPKKYKEVSEWVDKHFIFIEVENLKEATDVTKFIIEKQGIKIHALLLDPINSFKSGWQDTGNGYADGVVSALELLNFSKKVCSVHISQHPTMSGQRQEGAVTSYQAEGGWYLNKASFTYVINRDKGSSANELIVENVRNKLTGGGETQADNPLILDWKPTSIGVRYANGSERIEDVIQFIINRDKLFSFHKNNVEKIEPSTPSQAFGDFVEIGADIPF